MRTEILNYLKGQTMTGFSVTDELPYLGTKPLYLKNSKRVYLDNEQRTKEVLIPVLGSSDIYQEIHSVRILLSTDAKNKPASYNEVINTIKSAQEVVTSEYYFKREVDDSTTFDGDLLVTEINFKFTKLT